jgi:hypothetical protein
MSKSALGDQFVGGLRLVLFLFFGWLQPEALRAVPVSPTNLVATIVTNGVWLKWSPGDNAAGPNDFSYHIRVGSGSGASDIEFANAGHHTNFFVTLAAPPIGPVAPHYYWSVQAVDSTQAGGPFAEERSFVMAAVPRIFHLERTTNGMTLLYFAGSNQASYTVESSDDLITWRERGQVHDSGTEVYFYGDESTVLAPSRFYRVKYP